MNADIETGQSRNRGEAHMPTDVDNQRSWFDRFAEAAAGFISRAPFFAFCILVVLIWLPSYVLFESHDEWQIVIHTITAIITFLMVALLKNSETRADSAIQGKLNAIAGAVAVLMEAQTEDHPELESAIKELRHSVGLENVESS